MTIESLVRQDELSQREIQPFNLQVATTDLAHGRTIVLVMASRAFLTFPAETATREQTAFCIRHTSGFIQAALTEQMCEQFLIPEIHSFNTHKCQGVRQCVAVDAVGVTTGISASDRARTARTLGRLDTTHLDITRPGHVIVTKVDDRPPAASVPHFAVKLCEIATGRSAMMFAELVSPCDQRKMAGPDEAVTFAQTHGLTLVHL